MKRTVLIIAAITTTGCMHRLRGPIEDHRVQTAVAAPRCIEAHPEDDQATIDCLVKEMTITAEHARVLDNIAKGKPADAQ